MHLGFSAHIFMKNPYLKRCSEAAFGIAMPYTQAQSYVRKCTARAHRREKCRLVRQDERLVWTETISRANGTRTTKKSFR